MRIPRLRRVGQLTHPKEQPWSAYPLRPQPFKRPEWTKTKYKGNVRVTQKEPMYKLKPVTPYKEFAIVDGDWVEVMVGPDTGKQGKVRVVAKLRNQLKVENLNGKSTFSEDMGDGKPGYIIEEEPLHYTEVKLVDPVTGLPTEVRLEYDENGKNIRICKESGRTIPLPPEEHERFKDKTKAPEGEFDTKQDVVEEYTYVPSLLHFHEEIMKEMNIPMSIPKTQLERRDLIMKEIEEDLAEEERAKIEAELAEIEELEQIEKGYLSKFVNIFRR